MNKKPDSDASWSPCPAGTLSKFGTKELARRARLMWFTASLGIGAVAMVAAVGWAAAAGILGRTAENQVVWHCDAVLEHVDSYFADNIAKQSRSQIERHLKRCPYCHRRYQQRAHELGLDLGVAAALPFLHAPARTFCLARHSVLLFAAGRPDR